MKKKKKNFATRMRNEVTLCKYQWLHKLDNLENLYKSSDSHDDRATFLAERRSIILQLSTCLDEKDNTFAKKGIDAFLSASDDDRNEFTKIYLKEPKDKFVAKASSVLSSYLERARD